MGGLFKTPKYKPDPSVAQQAAEAKAKADAEAAKLRQQEEDDARARAMGLRGFRGFLSEAGETGFPTTLGGV